MVLLVSFEDNDGPQEEELGYILVSMNEFDAPVPCFSEYGTTPCEELLSRVRSTDGVRILRFGPTFATIDKRGWRVTGQHGEPTRFGCQRISSTSTKATKERFSRRVRNREWRLKTAMADQSWNYEGMKAMKNSRMIMSMGPYMTSFDVGKP